MRAVKHNYDLVQEYTQRFLLLLTILTYETLPAGRGKFPLDRKNQSACTIEGTSQLNR